MPYGIFVSNSPKDIGRLIYRAQGAGRALVDHNEAESQHRLYKHREISGMYTRVNLPISKYQNSYSGLAKLKA